MDTENFRAGTEMLIDTEHFRAGTTNIFSS